MGLSPERLNRIILLTDGQANVGKTDPDAICTDVHGLLQRGISTTTLGVGLDYNEDLLEAMARSGDGNYEFIEHASQLPAIFEKELNGLMATSGHTVSLGIEPQQGAEVVDVLNDLERNTYGRLLLPNLTMGSPISVVVRLQVPARRSESDICFARVAWTDPTSGERHVIREALSVPAIPSRELEALPEDPQVVEQVALLEAARIRQQAILEMTRGDIGAARQSLRRGREYVEACMAPSPMAAAEVDDFVDLDQRLSNQDVASASKAAKYGNYRKRRSR
jgi:Ca-activated chloride channel family protein